MRPRYERDKEMHHRDPSDSHIAPEGRTGETNTRNPHGEEAFRKESPHVHQKLDAQKLLIEQQRMENESLKRQVKNLQEQYKTRERQIATEKKATGLEIRLRQAKATQQVKLSQQQVLVVSEAYQQRLREAQNNERDIQSHLRQYTEKFEQFQDTLSKSNEIFATFKQEMERMTKTIARLEKDRSFLQAKCEQTDITLIEMAEERNNQRKQLEVLQTKNTRLGALCRVLQAERKREEPGDSRNSKQEQEGVTEPN